MVASIGSAASSSGTGLAGHVIEQGSAGSSQPVKKVANAAEESKVSKNSSTPPKLVQSSQPAGQQAVPLGVLEAVNRPAGGNFEASLDYADLRTALESGNLSAAQRAYLRLQSDLILSDPNLASGAATTDDQSHLNVKG